MQPPPGGLTINLTTMNAPRLGGAAIGTARADEVIE